MTGEDDMGETGLDNQIKKPYGTVNNALIAAEQQLFR